MTDRERKVAQLRRLIRTAHEENYDFVYLPVGDAKVIVRLLDERKEVEKDDKTRAAGELSESGNRYQPDGTPAVIP